MSGEYEGYREYAKTVGVRTEEVEQDKAFTLPEPGIWFISNPSARDGNIIDNDFIRKLCEQGHSVYLDLAYVGSTQPYKFYADHKNIPVVFLSLSKPHGLFRKRIGFTYARNEIPSLVGNKWFKRDDALLVGLRVIEEVGLESLPSRYRAVQKKVVELFNRQSGLQTMQSDSILLSHIHKDEVPTQDKKALEEYKEYKRAGGYRFTLTPFFEREEAK